MPTPMTTLHTPRLILRPWTDSDLILFACLNSNVDVMEFMPDLLTTEESNSFASRIRAHFDEHGFGLWAVEIPDVASFIGFIGLQWATFEARFTPALEVGFRLAPEHWNQGYATEGAQAALQHAFEQTGVDEVVSFTSRINTRSQHVIQKLGLTLDTTGDFDHPRVAEGHRLRPHVLYRIRNSQWAENEVQRQIPND